jgi:hypothetical protein
MNLKLNWYCLGSYEVEVGGATRDNLRNHVCHFTYHTRKMIHETLDYIIRSKSGHALVPLQLSVYGCIQSCTVGCSHVQLDPVMCSRIQSCTVRSGEIQESNPVMYSVESDAIVSGLIVGSGC